MTGPGAPPEGPKAAGGRFATLMVWLVLCGLLTAAAIGLVAAFGGAAATRISMHGWIAMALGGVIALALGIGLMALGFHSARAGYDDRADPGRIRGPDAGD